MKTTQYILSAFTVWVLLLSSFIKLDSIAASLFENNWFNFPYKTLVRPFAYFISSLKHYVCSSYGNNELKVMFKNIEYIFQRGNFRRSRK